MPPETAPIAREQLIRGLMEEIPLFGKLLEKMTYGVTEGVKKAEDKAELDAVLNAHTTDLGDILKALREQREFSLEMQSCISALTRYLEAVPTTHDIITVESAAVHEPGLLPATVDSVAHYLVAADVDRFQLDQLLMSLTEIEVDKIIGDIPNSRGQVRMEAAQARKVEDLLVWAESRNGPTLKGLSAYIARREAQLRNHPR